MITSITLRDGVNIIGESLYDTIFWPRSSEGPSPSFLFVQDIGRVTTNVSNLSFIGTYDGCTWNGSPTGENYPGGVFDASPLDETFNEFLNPAVVTFLNGTFQNSVMGILIESASCITIDNCWFERLHVGVKVSGNEFPSRSINIVNSQFLNVSGYGSIYYAPAVESKANGACVQTSKSYVNVSNNYVITSTNLPGPQTTVAPYYWIEPSCKFIYAFPDNLGLIVSGNTFSSRLVNETAGIVPSITVSGGNADLKQHRLVMMSSSTPNTNINHITSYLNTTEILVIKAKTIIKFKNATATGDNIIFSSTTGILTLQIGDVATFIKNDNGGFFENNFQLMSLLRAIP